MSYEQFLKLPEEYNYAEWVDGEVVMMAAVTNEHDRIRMWLARLIGDYCDVTEIGEVKGEPFQMNLVRQSRAGRAPDLMVVLQRRLRKIRKLFLEGPADLVIEIISPGTARVDRVKKFSEYQRGRVPEYWIIDPYRKKAEYYQLKSGRYVEHEPDPHGVYHSSSVAGIWIKTAWLWQRPLPSTIECLREIGVL